MSVDRKYETKTYTKTERVLTSEKRYCDMCKKEITGPHWEISTWHNDWGNDSCESFEYIDICSSDCLRKTFEKYIECSKGSTNTQHIEVKHVNHNNVKGEIKYD